jgi:hypothetical protein
MDYREKMGSGALAFAKRHYLAILLAANLVLVGLIVLSYSAPDCQEGATLIQDFIAQKGHGDVRDVFIACKGAEKVFSLEKKQFVPASEAEGICDRRGCGLWTQGNTRRKRDVCYCLRPPRDVITEIVARRCYKVVFKDILGLWKIDEVDTCDEARDFCCQM